MSFPPPTKDWASLSKPNPELETLLPLLGGYQLVTPNTTIHSLRALSAGRKPSQPLADVIEKDLQIPMRDGALNRARSYTPRKPPTGGMPLLVLVYGGSWLMGQLEQEEPNCRAWASKLGGVAVSLDHRHAPEHPFPGPHNDIYDGVKWVAANYKSLDADPSKGFIIGGVSSGSTSMIAVSHQWRDEGLIPPLTGLYLSLPSPCIVSALPEKYKLRIMSWEQNKDAPVFNRASNDFSFRRRTQYSMNPRALFNTAPDETNSSFFLLGMYNPDPFSPLRSPLLFPTGHRNLPPAYFIIAGSDAWRDVGLLYEEILREDCGIKTKVDVFPGLPHGFWTIFPQTQFSKDHAEKSLLGLKWLLEQTDEK